MSTMKLRVAEGAFDQELRELYRRAGTGLQLPLDGALVLAQNFDAAARFDLAGIEVEDDLHFPWLEAIAGDLAAQNFADQALESVQGEFALYQVVG